MRPSNISTKEPSNNKYETSTFDVTEEGRIPSENIGGRRCKGRNQLSEHLANAQTIDGQDILSRYIIDELPRFWEEIGSPLQLLMGLWSSTIACQKAESFARITAQNRFRG